MSGREAVATAHWRRLDGEGSDRCTLSRVAQGWIMVGHAHWRDEGCDTTLSYDIRCAPDWRSLSADVAGERGGRPLSIRIEATPLGWRMDDVLQPGTEDCTDLDLSFTPATNLMPIRRLGAFAGDELRVAAAWLMPDLDCVARLDQIYTRLPDGRVHYASAGFAAELDLHGSGFATQYPGLWQGWVDDA
ncbi:putative glycolipid-binding domain-containing protein [Ruegeria pomeroyi]|nr:putative glycolipid-binding domain-containing protein [Ruegeria pomeroyi]